MAQKAHVCKRISILSISAIKFASKPQPLKIVSRCTRTACSVSGWCACAASDMTRLTYVINIWVKSCVALEFATTPLQFHGHTHSIDNSKITLSAGSISRRGALKAFSSARWALFVDHIRIFVVRAVIYTSGALQEETVLTFLALRD